MNVLGNEFHELVETSNPHNLGDKEWKREYWCWLNPKNKKTAFFMCKLSTSTHTSGFTFIYDYTNGPTSKQTWEKLIGPSMNAIAKRTKRMIFQPSELKREYNVDRIMIADLLANPSEKKS
mgnify:CR=1 FL=1